MIAVGTAATRGTAPLRLYDLLSGAHLMDLGSDLKKGAGMLDIAWLSPSTLLSCGYDTFTRLWDTRFGAPFRCHYGHRNCCEDQDIMILKSGAVEL